MGRAVAFTTPGLIDIRAFTIFGVNAKPRTQNPIGYFGTGLKFATAALCRGGASPRLFIGRDEYQFYVRGEKFRDKDYNMVRMRRRKWSLVRSTHHQLPFSTDLGKDWEIWQAFRELESNTRDEGGTTELLDGDWEARPRGPDQTLIIVEDEKFVEAYLDRDKTFLPGGLSVREDGTRVQVMDRPTDHLYYRGLRIADVPKRCTFTYNFLCPLELTEDRTLKHTHSARTELARHVVTSHDEKMIESILTAPEELWEHGLEFDYQSEPPSEEFHAVINRRRGAVSRSALRYYGGWAPASARTQTTWQLHPRPWTVDYGVIYDASGVMVLMPTSEVLYKEQFLQDVVDLCNKEN